MTELYFLPLAGQDEYGGGCFALIINDDIFIFDAGAKKPFQNALGVKRVLPDTNWLELNKEKVKGVLIGNPSSLTTDGLLHLVNKINPKLPVYVTELGKMFIEPNFSHEIHKCDSNFSFNFHIINPRGPFYVAYHKIIPFTTFSGVPLSVGFIIKDNDGDVIIINDFILNNDYSKLYINSLSELPLLAHNVKLLIVSAGNVSNSIGFTTPNFKIENFILNSLQNSHGRVIICFYEDQLYYLYALAKMARQLHRTFIIYSMASVNVFAASIKMKLFNSNNLITLPIAEINNSDNSIIAVVNKVSELYGTLKSIIAESDKHLIAKKDDLFLLCTGRVPGVEKIEADIIDDYTKAEIPMIKMPSEILPIKASAEDQKYLIRLVKPRHVIPINGLYKDFVNYRDAISATGINPDLVHIVYNGEVFNLNKPNDKMEHVALTEKYVDNLMFDNEVDYPILFERERMSTDGFAQLIVLFSIVKDKVILVKSDLNLVGVVDKSFLESIKYKDILNLLWEKIKTYFSTLNSKDYDNKEMKNSLKKITDKFLEKQLNKKPLLLVIISQVKSDELVNDKATNN